MEDHHQNHDQNQYGVDLRQFVNSRIGSSSSSITPPFITTINPHQQQILGGPAEAFTMHRINVTPQQSNSGYDMMMLMPDTTAGLHKFRGSDGGSTTTATAAAFVISPTTTAVAATTGLGLVTGLDVEGNASFVGCGGGVDGGNARWPRQETLTLLEIRSRLDYKFKEANQKGPLWDEVSRMMCEEYGYQRSGKKCREKFENLYKYYKKTKEGKAGRQDGKHYRFFRQLEALCGDQTNQQLAQQVSAPAPHFLVNSSNFNADNIQEAYQIQSSDFESNDKLCESLSLSCSSGFNTSSSGGNNDGSLNVNVVENIDSGEKRRKRPSNGKSWKKKIKDFIDMKIGKLMERQEAWLEKLTTTLEEKEKERVVREELWRKQEVERIERAHKLWSKERSWIEARDAALMDALHNITGRSDHHQVAGNSNPQNENANETIINMTNSWPEAEISRLIQLRTSMDSRFQQGGCREEVLWEEIAAKMSCLGYERSGLMCKQKWDCISNYMKKNKKLPNSRSSSSCYNFQSCNESVYNPGDHPAYNNSSDVNEQARNDVAVATSDSSFRFMINNEGENLWENYGLKLSRGDHQS